MGDVIATGMLGASRVLLIVGFLAPVIAVFYMLRTVAHLKPGVNLWLDAPLLNPLNHIFVTRNLTEEGLKYRKRAVLAIGTFFVAWFASAGLDALASRLTSRSSGPASPSAERPVRYATTKDQAMRRTTILLWAAVLALLGTSVAQAQSAQEIAKRAFASTVLLVMEDTNGQTLSLGSGFFVRDSEVASNLHVVEGAARGYAKIVGQKAKYDIEGVTAIDPERDLVVLKISGARASTLPLGSSDVVQTGETVYAVGNPQGLEGTFSQGIVSSIREVGTDKLLQITAPISPGSSGGPVLNAKGEVIGVSVATFKGGQNLNFAIPSNYLKPLLGKTGPARPLAQAKAAKTQRSILADLGGRSVDGVVGGSFAWANQLYEMDGRYTITLTNRLREPVRSVHCLVVFYGRDGNPLDVSMVYYRDMIPAGLGKRISGNVDASVKRLTTPPSRDNQYLSSFEPSAKVEFRILNFEIVQ